MPKRSRQLAVLLALLTSAASAAAARESGPPGDASPHPSRPAPDAAPSYGEVLTELARKSALRAARTGSSNATMEAISELAVRWLDDRDDGPAERVWDRHPRSEQSVRLAIRNAERSLWRTQRRHHRIARITAATPDDLSTPPSQLAALQLAGATRAIDPADRDLLLGSAQGMSSHELARALGVTAAAARQRLARARRKLRDHDYRRVFTPV